MSITEAMSLTKNDKTPRDVEIHHLTVVSQIALKLLSLHSTKDIVWALAHEVVAQLGFEDIVIYLFDEDSQSLYQAAAFGNKNPTEYQILSPIKLNLGEGIVGKCAKIQQSVIVKDTRQCPDYIIDDQARLSEIAIPMLVGNSLIGVIDSEHHLADFYNQHHQKCLESIALIAATKISQARLIDSLTDTVEELEYSSKIQDTLFQIAEIIFETHDMQSFYQKLHQCISKLTYAKNLMVGILTDDKSNIHFPYSVDEYDDYPGAIIPFNRDKPSISGWVLKHNTGLLVTDSDLQQMIDDNELYIYGTLPKAWLGVPFGDESSLQGLVVVQNYTDDYQFSQQDKQLLSFAAKHIRNAIERMQAREELKYLALHDALTKLPNRSLFNDRVNQALLALERKPERVLALLYLDLDKFKSINDTFGHQIGDELLISVAQRVSACLRQADTLCRLGGDEFAILMEALDSKREANDIAQRIVDVISQPFKLSSTTISTSTSVGISFFDDTTTSAQQLVKQADEAMYLAKRSGRNQVKVFVETTASIFNTEIFNELSLALNQNDFAFEFQPFLSFHDKSILGVEVFIRWQHPTLGILPPDDFLNQVNKLGLGHQIDLYVTKHVVRLIHQHWSQLPANFVFNINLSEQGIVSDELMNYIQLVYKKQPQIVSKLCFEVTEEIYNEQVNKVSMHINLLRAMGALVSLDDFGTGYSSLSVLDKFSFDSLKLDHSFVEAIKPGLEINVILKTIIKLARTMGISLVAEGIENKFQYDQMKKLKCDIAQGFYLVKPMEFSDLLTSLQNNAVN